MAKKISWKSIRESYIRFTEGHGFAVIVTVCVAVITGTAVWTQKADAPYVSPTPPNIRDVSAAQLMQQSLADAETPIPEPTAAPIRWLWPVKSRSVLRGFDDARMVQSGVTGLWAIHDAVDLPAASGEVIRAIADGTVIACGDDGLEGAFVTLAHPQGITAHYAGMAMLAALREGDIIHAGQTLGFGGNGILGESDLAPHLHLRIARDGRIIDPMQILSTAEGQ